MEATHTVNPKGEAGVASSDAASDSGLLEQAKSLWHELRELAHDQLTLAALETKLAGKSLVTMIAAGVMIAVLLISAWLGLLAAAVLWFVAIGLSASIAILLGVGANLLLALILYEVIRRQSRHLQFPATLRSLRPVPTQLQGQSKP